MEKRFYFLLAAMFFARIFGQTAVEVNKVESSKDPVYIESFVKKYPNFPLSSGYAKKAIALRHGDDPTFAKPKIQTMTEVQKMNAALKKQAENDSAKKESSKAPSNSSNSVSSVNKSVNVSNNTTTTTASSSAKNDQKKTVDLLNHLFSNDPNSKEAYIQITNKSKCNLIMKISGPKYYNLTVPANNSNYILVDKGTYTMTTSICDAKYSSVKNVSKDLVITLNSSKR